MKPEFLLLFSITCISITHQYSKCVDLSFYSCRVCYQDYETQNFFLNCTKRECGSYYEDEEGNSRCQSHIQVNLPEEQCFKQCCGNEFQTYKFSIDSLKQCKDLNDTSLTIALITAGAIFLCCFVGCFCLIRRICCGVPCCTCSFCISCERIRYFLCCRCLQGNQNQVQYYQERPNPYGPENNGNFNNYEWKRDLIPCYNIQNNANTCAICLLNNVDCITNCGHIYHLNCIVQWFQRNQACPICTSGWYNPVRFYCRSCYTGYSEIILQQQSNFYEIVRNIRGPNCPICQ